MKTRTLTALQLVALTAQIVLIAPGHNAEDDFIRDDDSHMVFKIISRDDRTVTLLYLDPEQAYGITEATVPDTVKDKNGTEYTVVSISNYSFESDTLKHVTVPNTVTSIATQAFEGSLQLTDITVAQGSQNYRDIDGVLYSADAKKILKYPMGRTQESYSIQDETEIIGSRSFYASSNLKYVSVKQIHTIEEYAFFTCEELGTAQGKEQIEYRSTEPTVKHIGQDVFYGCVGMTTFHFGTLEDIGPEQFAECMNLTVVNLPETLIYIDSSAFSFSRTDLSEPPKLSAINVQAGNPFYSSYDGVLIDDTTHALITYPAGKEDETFTIPDSVLTLQRESFRHNTFLKVLKYPVSVVFIDEYQLQDCTSLETFEFAVTSKLYQVGEGQFYDCTSLKNVSLDNVAYIGQNAFSHCISLTTLIIPSSVLSIGELAFYRCDSLTEFIASNPNGYYQIDGVLFFRSQNAHSVSLTLVSYPLKRSVDGELATSYTVPPDTAQIESYAFNHAPLKTLVLSKNILSIEEFSFTNMGDLESVDLCGSVTRIGNSAFEKCCNLSKVTGASAVTVIDSWQFNECKKLTELPDMPALKSLGPYCLNNTGLRDVVLPSTVEKLGTSVFSRTANMTSLEIKSTQADIDTQAFADIGMVSDTESNPVTLKCSNVLLKDYVGQIPDNLTVKYYEDREFPMENIIGIVVCIILLVIIANSFRRI